MQNEYIDKLPNTLKDNAISLSILNIDAVAFTFDMAEKFADFILQSDFVLLGGDIYRLSNNIPEFSEAGENWSSNPKKDDGFEKFKYDSVKKMIDYLNLFKDKSKYIFPAYLINKDEFEEIKTEETMELTRSEIHGK